jgi:hypothetical protein
MHALMYTKQNQRKNLLAAYVPPSSWCWGVARVGTFMVLIMERRREGGAMLHACSLYAAPPSLSSWSWLEAARLLSLALGSIRSLTG